MQQRMFGATICQHRILYFLIFYFNCFLKGALCSDGFKSASHGKSVPQRAQGNENREGFEGQEIQRIQGTSSHEELYLCQFSDALFFHQ